MLRALLRMLERLNLRSPALDVGKPYEPRIHKPKPMREPIALDLASQEEREALGWPIVMDTGFLLARKISRQRTVQRVWREVTRGR